MAGRVAENSPLSRSDEAGVVSGVLCQAKPSLDGLLVFLDYPRKNNMKLSMKTIPVTAASFCILALGLCGCSTLSGPPQVAVADIKPAPGQKAHGTVTFTKVSSGVRVVADIVELTPGEHGFHMHENGDCSGTNFITAGPHFNPAGMPHGGPNSVRRHSGDFGNLTANGAGHAHLDFIEPLLTFNGPSTIIGRSIIVHEKVDDLVTDPSGNSGARIACGVVVKKED